MKVLVPNFKCTVTEEEYLAGQAEGYSEIFIVANDGIFYHETKLSRGRVIRDKVETLPTSKKSELAPVNTFLPAGKIPVILFKQVVSFFLEVMNTLHAYPEAMIHILWNETDGYHLGVPSQEVSAASVKYEYDHMKEGDIIVVDIHSHNKMGAFFSATDNGDDRGGIYFSGVLGRLDKPEYESTWRFNNRDRKTKCQLEDIFEAQEEKVEFPKEFLDKVKSISSSSWYGGGAGRGAAGSGAYGGMYGGYFWDDEEDERFAGRGHRQTPTGSSPTDPLDIEGDAITDEEMDLLMNGNGDFPSADADALAQVLTWLEDISDPGSLEQIIRECEMMMMGE